MPAGQSGEARPGFVAALALASVMGLALGCGNNLARPATLRDCSGDASCPDIPNGGSGSPVGVGSDAGGIITEAGSADDASVAVTFTIAALIDTTFLDSASYTKAVRVTALAPDGQLARTSDAGVVSSGVLTGAHSGLNWFAVEDVTGTFAIASTLQPVAVNPADLVVVLHAVARDALDGVFVDGVPWVRTAGRASVILVFLRNGQPVPGITVTDVPAAMDVAYDRAPPDYTVLTDVTDTAGVVLVRDIAVPTVFPALTTVTIRYRAGTQSFSLDVRLAQDFMTWIEVTVPN